MSNSLRPNESQHTRPPCPSPVPRAYSNPCPTSRWCHPAISSSVVPFSACPPIPPSIRVFSNESTLHMRWPKYWSFSFSISPSNEHRGLISFRTDWLDLLAVQGTLKSLLQTTLSSFMAMPTAVSWLVSCVEMWTFKQKASFSTSGLSRTATLAFQAAPCWEELACMAILMWQLEAGHWQLSLVSHEFILDLTNCFKNVPSHKS